MTEQNDLSPKSDAAIQVRVCGHDFNGEYFDETTTAFPTSKGIMLETVHQLREGCTLEITHILMNRKTITQVKSMGPQLGLSRLVFLEGANVGDLWMKGPAKESGKTRRYAAHDDSHPATETSGNTLAPIPEHALTQIARLRMPTMDRFMDTFGELVESALDENLRPTVEQLTNEIQQKMVKTQSDVLAAFEEKIQAMCSTVGDRLDGRVVDVVAQNEKVLTKRIQEWMGETQSFVKDRQAEMNENAEAAVRSGREHMTQQADGVLAEVNAKSQERIQEELRRFDQQLAERLQATIADGQINLSDRARQAEADLAERLAGKINDSLEKFSAELEKRCLQALATHTSLTERHLKEAESAMTDRAAQAAQRLMERVADQSRASIARSLRVLAEVVESEVLVLPRTADAAD